MRVFDLDGPLMSILNKIADMMILNILALICCLPIFTAGAAFTALHYVALKIVRNEEGYIAKSFFKAFKENFKQATIIWMVLLVAILLLVADFWLIKEFELELGYWFKVILGAVFVLVIFTATFVFAALARFSNTTLQTIKNAFAMSVLQFPKTILMIILYLIPIVAGAFF
ncbi:MAG: YesL family protein, partial [Lachnospiraceae bacterium]|nr:YesL family protein [Lachnospiraceae bacterium]